MTGKFATNPHYVEYEELLKKLSRLMAEGRGDSDEADAVREAMEWPERELTREELDRLNGLSADLYMLHDAEIYGPLEPGEDRAERTPERLGALLREAGERGDAEAQLALLRRGPTDLTQEQRAYVRARAYEALGHLDTALLFMRYAAERNPGDSHYEWGVLNLLDRLKQRDELYQRASDCIRDEAASPELRVYAAGLLFGLTRGLPLEQAAPVVELVVSNLQSTLPLFESASRLLLPDLPAYGQLTLGFCYQRLGKREDALNAFNKAMNSPKHRGTALGARGMLHLAESRPEEALSDFEEAIAGNTPLVTPYLHLAHHALIEGNYERCLELCDRALEKTRNLRIQAVVLQWEAIAGFELGAPMDQVRRALEVALSLDPLNPRIRHNFTVFQNLERTSSAASLRSQWQPPAAPAMETADLLDPMLPVAA